MNATGARRDPSTKERFLSMFGHSNVPPRIWAKLSVTPEGCWVNLRSVSGYANIQSKPAHRWMYQALVGPIPAGKQIDHLCRNTRCCNPDHLEPVTAQDNVLRGAAATPWGGVWKRGMTHCRQGHPYSRHNIHVRGGGQLTCLQCHQARHQLASLKGHLQLTESHKMERPLMGTPAVDPPWRPRVPRKPKPPLPRSSVITEMRLVNRAPSGPKPRWKLGIDGAAARVLRSPGWAPRKYNW